MNDSTTKSFKVSGGTFKLSPEEISNQITNYYTLSIWKSYRKQAAMIIFLSVLFTIIIVFMFKTPITLLLISILLLYVVLGVFVYRGKQWAIGVTAIIFAIDKIASVITVGFIGIIGLLWLLAFLSSGYKACRIESERAKTV